MFCKYFRRQHDRSKETRKGQPLQGEGERLNVDNLEPLDLPGVRREMLGPPEVWDPKEGVLFLRCIIPLLNMDPVLVRVSLKAEVDGGISDHGLRENGCHN